MRQCEIIEGYGHVCNAQNWLHLGTRSSGQMICWRLV